MVIDPKLVEILACPACDSRPPLRLAGETLVCDVCRRVYMIRDGIPILLPEEAILPDDGDPAVGRQSPA
jgi:uncharacterized protein YbaR (Trm112 family)